LGLTLALEIVRRGGLHGFDDWDVHGPLLELLRCHGPVVIAEVEVEARRSEALRRVIWTVRGLNPDPDRPHAIGAEVWRRFLLARGNTTTHDSERPHWTRRSLGAEHDELLDRWFVSECSFWAWCEVDDLVRDDPEQGWEVILALLRGADTEKALVDIGCGPLEDLVRRRPAELIERVERLAGEDPRFRLSLGCVWLTLEDVPEPLAGRYWEASGRELSVLGAPRRST
jgi:hypothetical protein